MSQNYFCKYCGSKASNISTLTNGSCSRHPNGANKGKHTLYQGTEKTQYSCQYCGTKASTISNLTIGTCVRHPLGSNKGHHEPALN